MKVLLVNGSPKRRKSASDALLTALEEHLPGCETARFESATGSTEELLAAGADCGALVFAFPLYVDGIPAHLLRLLEDSCPRWAEAAPGARVYAVVNNGFFEPEQNRNAIDMMKHFAARAGLVFGRALAVGAGPMAVGAPLESGPMKGVPPALGELAQSIQNGEAGTDLLLRPGMPRFLYRVGGNAGWRRGVKKYGLTAKDLYRRLPPPEGFPSK